jgi:hypothetical protein
MLTIDLRKHNLREAAVGTIVITSKGFVFERVSKDQWKDLTTGLKWFYPEEKRMIHHQAVETYSTDDKRLPTKGEFEIAEEHGFREVLEIDSGWFWSSSVNPSNTYYAYVFFVGYYGGIGFDSRDFNVDSVVCVAGR